MRKKTDEILKRIEELYTGIADLYYIPDSLYAVYFERDEIKMGIKVSFDDERKAIPTPEERKEFEDEALALLPLPTDIAAVHPTTIEEKEARVDSLLERLGRYGTLLAEAKEKAKNTYVIAYIQHLNEARLIYTVILDPFSKILKTCANVVGTEQDEDAE